VKRPPSVIEPDAPPADPQEPKDGLQNGEGESRRRLFEDDAGPRVADALLGFLGVLVLLSWLVVAVAHAHDLFGLNHIAGSRMDLASYARHHAAIYPPLFDGHHLWGTRYMPIPLLLHAGLSFLTGEFLTSGKLLSYLAMAAIVVLVYVALRRERVPRGWSLSLASVVLLTQSGFVVGTAIVADGVPVALQLAAVLVATSRVRSRVPLAAALCALALFSKQSAVWAPVAICAWLWIQQERPSVWRFAVSYVSGVAVLFGTFMLVTHGRFLSVLALTFAGESAVGSAVGRPVTLLHWFPVRAAPIAILLPFAAVAVARGLRSRRPTAWHLSLIVATGILLVVWTDAGTEYNHLIDVVVLISLVAGGMWAKDAATPGRLRPDRAVTAVLVVAVAWAMLFSNDQLMAKAVRDALGSTSAVRSDRWSVQPLRSTIPAGSTLLAEDPTIPLMLGREPVVEDAFMVPRIGRSHPEYVRWLVRQIGAKSFDHIVLEKRMDRAPSWWYGSLQFGPDVIHAVAAYYRFEARVGAYVVYVPRA
jgi:hypothetical protein